MSNDMDNNILVGQLCPTSTCLATNGGKGCNVDDLAKCITSRKCSDIQEMVKLVATPERCAQFDQTMGRVIHPPSGTNDFLDALNVAKWAATELVPCAANTCYSSTQGGSKLANLSPDSLKIYNDKIGEIIKGQAISHDDNIYIFKKSYFWIGIAVFILLFILLFIAGRYSK